MKITEMNEAEIYKKALEYMQERAVKLQFFFDNRKHLIPFSEFAPTTKFAFMHPFQIYELLAGKHPITQTSTAKLSVPEEMRGLQNPVLKVDETTIYESVLIPEGVVLMLDTSGPFSPTPF